MGYETLESWLRYKTLESYTRTVDALWLMTAYNERSLLCFTDR